MNSRHTWFWLVLAAVLFGFIFFFQRHKKRSEEGPPRLLPEIRAAALTAIQVRPAALGQLAIRAERTNGGWQLTEPITYPALTTNVQRLAESLENLVAATTITPDELRSHKNADQVYGFASPQASVIVQQGEQRVHLLVGALTPPGDQVFVQVVGTEGAYVTDAQWLKTLPTSANDWRDTSLVLEDLSAFDRIAVTNSSRAFVLQRDARQVWRMVWPLNSARADNGRIQEGINRLQQLQIRQFVSEDPKPEAEKYGLVSAALEVAFGNGNNTELILQFGNAAAGTNNQVYARRAGKPSIFSVDNEPLTPWRSTSVNDFRDPHLLTITEGVVSVAVRAEETFSIERQTNGTWQVQPENFPADPEAVQGLILGLAGLQILQFTKDVVNAPDLPEFGLASPARQYSVKSVENKSDPDATNCILAELNFGMLTNQPEKIYVRRSDEGSVYMIGTNEFAKLPTRSMPMRDRKFWSFSENDVSGVVVRQGGKVRELIRKGPHQWAFAPGSQGIINDLAVEETVRGLAHTPAVAWVARGESGRAAYGLDAAKPYQITVKLNSGQSLDIEFGNEAPSKNQYAAVKLDGSVWLLEFSWILYRDVANYLSIP